MNSIFSFVFRHTWQVQDKYMANNVAYTSGRLSFHTDYPALHFAPGVSSDMDYLQMWYQLRTCVLLSFVCFFWWYLAWVVAEL